MYTKSQNIQDICQERQHFLSQIRKNRREEILEEKRNISLLDEHIEQIIYELKLNQTTPFILIAYDQKHYVYEELNELKMKNYKEILNRLNNNGFYKVICISPSVQTYTGINSYEEWVDFVLTDLYSKFLNDQLVFQFKAKHRIVDNLDIITTNQLYEKVKNNGVNYEFAELILKTHKNNSNEFKYIMFLNDGNIIKFNSYSEIDTIFKDDIKIYIIIENSLYYIDNYFELLDFINNIDFNKL